MNVWHKCEAWIFGATFFALSASAAHAGWQAQWSAAWQHPELQHTAMPLRVKVAKTGETFAAVSVTHHQASHVALMKFDAAGNFLWLKEHVGGSLAGMVFSNDRIAIAGEGGTLAEPVFVSLYDAETGDLVWDRKAAGGRVWMDSRNNRQQLTVDANGDLMILASDQGDYVVIRFDPEGNALPTWRHTVDSSDDIDPVIDVIATGIVALPDGGAIVTGLGRNIGGGYVTVRLNAQGGEVYTDVELGEIGNPLGPAYLALAADDSVIVAAAPESIDGVPRARLWKLSSSGVHLWTRVPANTETATTGTMLQGLVLGTDGDAFTEISGLHDPFRVVCIAAATGAVIWDAAVPIAGNPTTLALAPNGRVLVGSQMGGHESGHIAEMDAGGNPCRVAENLGMFGGVIAGGSSSGWSILGTTQSVQGSSPDAFVSHFDGDGTCTLSDRMFENGFE